MANPQPDKFTRISNELLDALARFDIPGCERQVFDAIMRRTYGWNRTNARISLTELQAATNIPVHNIPRLIRRLELRNLIRVQRSKTGSLYNIQKDFDQWQVLSPVIVSPVIVSTETVSPVILSEDSVDSITCDNTPIITRDNTNTKTVFKDKKLLKSKDKTHKDTPAWTAAGRVLDYLNQTVGSHYRTSEKIHARLTQKEAPATEAECRAVIDDQWTTEFMRANPRYMNPDTLFGPEKFEKYRGQLGMKPGGNGQAGEPIPELHGILSRDGQETLAAGRRWMAKAEAAEAAVAAQAQAGQHGTS